MLEAHDTKDATPLLSLRDINVSFGPVRALSSVGLDVDAGEFRAVLGENGAGKSTLMNVIYGLVAGTGEIYWSGERVYIDSPLSARNLGIGMVHQELSLIDALSVSENLALAGGQSGFLIDYDEVRQRARERAVEIGLTIGDLDAKVGELPVGVRQQIEILKALLNDVDLLILDEPSAVLTPAESDALFEVLKPLRARGVAILFITHKLREVMAQADSVTVLRQGTVVAHLQTATTTQAELAELMVGRVLTTSAERRSPPLHSSSLRAVDLGFRAADGTELLQETNFELAAGEIFGVAGVTGNGQQELYGILSGVLRPSSGTVTVAGEPVRLGSPRSVSAAGVRSIPPERKRQGAVLEMCLWENALLDVDLLNQHSDGIQVDRKAAQAFADTLIEAHGIVCEGNHALASSLSGGNLQKVIVARALSGKPRVVIAANPTRGLDVAAAAHVHHELRQVTQWGGTVLLLSADLDEILSLSDRIAVLYRGHLSRPLTPPYNLREIGLLMGGSASRSATASVLR